MKHKTLHPSIRSRNSSSPLGGESSHRFSAELPLHELRQTKALSQVTLAKTMHVHQAAISKMEHRSDMYVSTLRDYIRALGGDLEIVARFPDGAVKISNFDDHPNSHMGQEATADGKPALGVIVG